MQCSGGSSSRNSFKRQLSLSLCKKKAIETAAVAAAAAKKDLAGWLAGYSHSFWCPSYVERIFFLFFLSTPLFLSLLFRLEMKKGRLKLHCMSSKSSNLKSNPRSWWGKTFDFIVLESLLSRVYLSPVLDFIAIGKGGARLCVKCMSIQTIPGIVSFIQVRA